MKEYVATFKTSRQISPDDWEVYNPTMKVTDSTTIGEINEWFKKLSGSTKTEVKLIEIENQQP